MKLSLSTLVLALIASLAQPSQAAPKPKDPEVQALKEELATLRKAKQLQRLRSQIEKLKAAQSQ